MKVYIAAPWKHKQTAALVRDQLFRAGIGSTSRWIDFPSDGSVYEHADDVMTQEAQNNVDDLGASDVMLYLNIDRSEGKATELGIALMYGLPIYVIGGKRNNVFLHLPIITHVDSVEEFLSRIERL